MLAVVALVPAAVNASPASAAGVAVPLCGGRGVVIVPAGGQDVPGKQVPGCCVKGCQNTEGRKRGKKCCD
jgi:hypothetical protein